MKNFNEAYETLKEEKLDDIDSMGYLFRHKKSGAMISIIENGDNNKVFYIGFKTLPKDSTGVMHIIEHTVLCGSKKYPLKDPFVELVKGSLNTFLNAMTYPDKTVYPIASTNEADFKNLMDVYMDAVFNPNIYKYEEIFKQEGWHYELPTVDSDLNINGIVYNEMKGAFSSPEEVLNRKIMNTLLKGTIYENESGGDPDIIPTLSREDFLNVHKKYYHPSNSYIYMYGNMNTAERLKYLDEEYLSKYDYKEFKQDISLHKNFKEEQNVSEFYSIDSNENPEKKNYLAKSYLVGNYTDTKLQVAFDILDYALLSSSGSVFQNAFVKSGMAEDVIGGYDSGIKEGIFSVILKNADEKDKDKFLEILENTLKDVVKNGIDKDTLIAAIEINKFQFLEADFGSYPKGLVFGLSLFDTWLYDKENPFVSLHVIDILDELLKEVNTGYFEKLVEKYLLNSESCAFVDLKAKPGLTVERDNELQEKLNKYRDSLSDEEREKLVKQTKELKAFQDEKPSPLDLEKIPSLEIKDLRKEILPLSHNIYKENDIKILHTDMDTSKIHYLDINILPENIEESKMPALSLYTKILGLIDTKNYTYQKLEVEKNKYTGGIRFGVNLFKRGDEDYIFTFFIKAKTFYDNEDKLQKLIEEILYNSKLDDKKRVKELLLKDKNYFEESIVSAGNLFSVKRAFSYFSKYNKVKDEISGIAYYDYLKAFLSDFDKNYEKFKKDILEIRKKLFKNNNVIISTTGREKALTYAKKISKYLFERNPKGDNKELFGQIYFDEPYKEIINEGFKTSSQVQYVCMAGNFKALGYKYSGVMNILESILGYDYFWLNLRVKGGAYGCMSGFYRLGSTYFVSYRDPKLKDTLYVYIDTYNYLNNFDVDDCVMKKYIIGTIGSMDTPLTPAKRGERDLNAYLCNISEEELQKERDEVLNATQQDIRNMAPLLKAIIDNSYICVIGSEDKIEKYKNVFDSVRTLI